MVPRPARAPGLRSPPSHATAAPGDFVTVHYTGTLEDGTEFDSSRTPGREPLSFELGAGFVVPGFDRLVTGLEVGGREKAVVPASDAYGLPNESLIFTVPRSVAPEDLRVGTAVQLSNGMRAVVVSIDDENIQLDANHQLAGKDLTFDVELVANVPVADQARITLAAGCFWGVELAFQRVGGVLSTNVGYTNGDVGVTKTPTYDEVCSGTTGYAEAVQVVYDPKQVGLEKLLEVFFDRHDPTQLNRQGNDVGTQYRSGIYYHDEATQAPVVAEMVKKEVRSLHPRGEVPISRRGGLGIGSFVMSCYPLLIV